MNLCIILLIKGLCFPRCLLVNFNKFLLSIRIIFALQLSINQTLVVLMLNNSALDTRDPQPGIILLEVGLLDLNYPSSHVSSSFFQSSCISVSTCVPLSLCIILMIMSLSLLYS